MNKKIIYNINKLMLYIVFTIFSLLTYFTFTSTSAYGFDYSIGIMSGYFEPTNSKDSYEAVYDSGGICFGVVGEIPLWNTFNFNFRASSFSKSGQRVYIDPSGNITKTGANEDLSIYNFIGGVKWKYAISQTIDLYTGIDLGFWNLKTDSTQKSYSKSGFGYLFLGGVKFLTTSTFSLFLEANYSSVPDMIGNEPNSTATYYNDTDIGGLGFNLGVSYNF